jgi:uncharacterized protein
MPVRDILARTDRGGASMTRAWAEASLFLTLASARLAAAEGPSAFDCAKAAGKVPLAVCADAALATLDRKLEAAYAGARAKALPIRTPETLEAEQRGFVQQRDACEHRRDVAACLRDVYVARVSELQAVHGLVPVAGRARFACEGDGPREIGATFFHSEVPTALLTAGDREVLLFQKTTASGTTYEGDRVVFRSAGGEAQVSWEELELRCRAAQ